MIIELEQMATLEAVANEVTMEEVGELLRGRQGIERKLSTTYSLGRDEIVSNLKSVPLYSGRTEAILSTWQRKYYIFHTFSSTSSDESSSDRDYIWILK
ncbi:hypothetical protein F3Y22_tig00003398pilonHSYRG00041 [Hibiscus syriacus]|uniref:Uncharacterized protein n=1 Tax=Hibiscus syriacus TaxID=106335 RepID=A0A6A3CMJ6_HIBSY|nr:hypothetical protein F3Y22_tig00003398pilonHSYRG00041 [Hibiscus syriacus]